MSKSQDETIFQEEIIDELSPPQYTASYIDNRDTVFSNTSNLTNETLVENDSIIIPKIKVIDEDDENEDYDESNYNFTEDVKQEQVTEQCNNKRKKSIYKP